MSDKLEIFASKHQQHIWELEYEIKELTEAVQLGIKYFKDNGNCDGGAFPNSSSDCICCENRENFESNPTVKRIGEEAKSNDNKE